MRRPRPHRLLLPLALALACAGAGAACGASHTPASASRTAAATLPLVRFLGVEQAADAIVDDSAEPYFSRLQPLEMSVKTARPIGGGSLREQQREARRRYRAAVRGFTPAEQEALRALVARVHPGLVEGAPALAEGAWSFLVVRDELEGGLPHTRGQHIVLPAWLVAEMARAVEAGSDAALQPFMTLLLHERVHVAQRRDPALFASLYEEVWGLEHVERIAIPDALIRRQVTNPDATDAGWVLPLEGEAQTALHLWPRLVFAPDVAAPEMPRDLRAVAVRLVRDAGGGLRPATDAEGRPHVGPLADEKAWIRAFPPVSSLFHPNEASAEALTHALMAEYVLPPAAAGSRAQILRPLAAEREWMREHLQERGGSMKSHETRQRAEAAR